MMIKPIKRTMEYLDYNECVRWIESKYGINLRDYTNKYNASNFNDKSIPYQNFWHSIVNNNDIHNGCFFFLDLEGWPDIKEWEKEILQMFKDEFGEYIEDDTIEFRVEW